jgi:hypothetical protein
MNIRYYRDRLFGGKQDINQRERITNYLTIIDVITDLLDAASSVNLSPTEEGQSKDDKPLETNDHTSTAWNPFLDKFFLDLLRDLVSPEHFSTQSADQSSLSIFQKTAKQVSSFLKARKSERLAQSCLSRLRATHESLIYTPQTDPDDMPGCFDLHARLAGDKVQKRLKQDVELYLREYL